MLKIKLLILVLALAGIGLYVHQNGQQNAEGSVVSTTKTAAKSAEKQVVTAVNHCTSNKLSQNIIIDISSQHLWACAGTKAKYDSAVITGMELYVADLTPTGSYKIYAKQTGQTLAGSDSTGSWSDYVYYWMPFLSNKYGIYGFHDLTQTANGKEGRANSDFGHININLPYTAPKHGSHGCVELPLATAKWLYNWSVVGTTVTIQS